MATNHWSKSWDASLSTPHSGCNNGRFNSFNSELARLNTFHVIPVVTGILGWAWTRINHTTPKLFFFGGVEKSNKSVKLLLMAEILHQLIGSLSHYLQGFIHRRWCRISEPSTVLPYDCTWGHEVKKNLYSMEFCKKKRHGQRPGNGL